MTLSNEIRRLTQGFVAAHVDRTGTVATIRDNTTQELSGFHTAHESMAAKQRKRLAGYVGVLRDNVTETLESLDTAHQDMAAKQRRRLAGGRKRLASDVSKMRAPLQADLSEARKTWNDFATGMQKRRVQKSGARSSAAPVTGAAQGLAVVARPPKTMAKAPVPQAKEARKPKSPQKRSGKF